MLGVQSETDKVGAGVEVGGGDTLARLGRAGIFCEQSFSQPLNACWSMDPQRRDRPDFAPDDVEPRLGALRALDATEAGSRGDVNEPPFLVVLHLRRRFDGAEIDVDFCAGVAVVLSPHALDGEALCCLDAFLFHERREDAPPEAEKCARAPLQANVRASHQPNSQLATSPF